MKAAVAAALCLAVLPAAPLTAQTANQTASAAALTLDVWHGSWAGTGTVMGREATATARFGPALGGAALMFDYDLKMGGSVPQRFHGHGVYRIDSKNRVTGQWIDSGNGLHQLTGQWSDREWTVIWGSPLTEIGRSRYVLNADGTLAITDWVLQKDGSWRVFGEMRYRRESL